MNLLSRNFLLVYVCNNNFFNACELVDERSGNPPPVHLLPKLAWPQKSKRRRLQQLLSPGLQGCLYGKTRPPQVPSCPVHASAPPHPGLACEDTEACSMEGSPDRTQPKQQPLGSSRSQDVTRGTLYFHSISESLPLAISTSTTRGCAQPLHSLL